MLQSCEDLGNGGIVRDWQRLGVIMDWTEVIENSKRRFMNLWPIRRFQGMLEGIPM